MNLHVFNDSHGFFLNLTVKRFMEKDALATNLFINLNKQTVYTNKNVQYLTKNILSFKAAVKKIPAVNAVIFYPFDFTAAAFLKEFKKKQPAAEVGWVFWGYEYYHRADMNKLNYDKFSLAFYKNDNLLFNIVKTACANILKSILFIPVFNKQRLNNAYRQINKFYSFLPQDFKNVFQKTEKNTCEYCPFALLSINEVNNGIEWGNVTHEVMIGHSASPTLNHAEILDTIYQFPFSSKIFLPLEYGEDEYRKIIKARAGKLFGSRVVFLENRLEMKDYYQRLSSIGFAVFNFRWQEALGNIIFLIWNGAKIFLKKESSVYKQFKVWGLTVFSIEDHLNNEGITTILSISERQKNKVVMETLFSEETVMPYWESLMLDCK
jgi:dTDP-N-acetylfucosamine:lipid II N-acetylfucosaminyltransferase